ncbi:MAG: hypothetical protein ACLUII_08245 [Paraprevotella clara]|uniref:hypothetical protein n=1 Tax=Paraprevotella clara TaxID=454154 RepID=UPI003990E267
MHISPATAAPASPLPCNITAARQTKEDFSWAAYGNDDTGRTGQARHGKSEYPYLPDKEP